MNDNINDTEAKGSDLPEESVNSAPEAELLSPEEVNGENQQKSPTAVNDDFDYVLGNDFLIEEEDFPEEKDHFADEKVLKHKSKKKSKGTLKVLAWITSIFLAAFALAFCLILFMSEYFGVGFNKGNSCVVDIKKGMSTSEIAAELKESGAINSQVMFRIYSKLSKKDGTYKYGVYTFVNELGYKELAEMLQTEGAVAKTTRVTIPERASMDDIMNLLEEKGVCTKVDFRNAVLNGKYDFDFVNLIPTNEVYYKFEGYLFPDTYDFYSYDSKECAELAIRKMLSNMNDKLKPEYIERAKKMGKSIHEILTMASIVELEASGSPSEMPNVAAVFYNRLKWDQPHLLGSSPTSKYPHGDGRYDTNIHPDLPPGPLCAPSLNAIKAALYPTENFKETYFVTDTDKKFYYNDTLAKHYQTIQKIKAQGKWPEE